MKRAPAQETALLTVSSVLERIASVSRVVLSGSSSAPEPLWSLEGKGTVSVARNSGSVCLAEEGTYTRSDHSSAFQASWWFSAFASETLRVGHARRGVRAPLTDLTRCASGEWTSVSPHLCGADAYSVSIVFSEPDSIEMRWRVRGPTKNHCLRRIYSLKGTL